MAAVQCAWEKEWPDQFRHGVSKVLHDCGFTRADLIGRDLDVHHIVAAALDGAAPARNVLAKWCISTHSAANAAIVPRVFHQNHGLHRQSFLDIVNHRMAAADLFAEALKPHAGHAKSRLIIVETLLTVGTELVLRSGDDLAMRLQAAMSERLTRSVPEGTSDGSTAGSKRPVRRARERKAATEERTDRAHGIVPGPRRPGVRLATACS